MEWVSRIISFYRNAETNVKVACNWLWKVLVNRVQEEHSELKVLSRLARAVLLAGLHLRLEPRLWKNVPCRSAYQVISLKNQFEKLIGEMIKINFCSDCLS